MRQKTATGLMLAAALAIAGCAANQAKYNYTKPPEAPAPAAQAIDLGNTVCPVTGDRVGDSKIVVLYDGKVYHLCCDMCPTDFKKNPDKYVAQVNANPAKYGVK